VTTRECIQEKGGWREGWRLEQRRCRIGPSSNIHNDSFARSDLEEQEDGSNGKEKAINRGA